MSISPITPQYNRNQVNINGSPIDTENLIVVIRSPSGLEEKVDRLGQKKYSTAESNGSPINVIFKCNDGTLVAKYCNIFYVFQKSVGRQNLGIRDFNPELQQPTVSVEEPPVKTREEYFAEIRENPFSLVEATENIKDDKEIVIEAVRRNPMGFIYASERLQSNREVFQALRQEAQILHINEAENLYQPNGRNRKVLKIILPIIFNLSAAIIVKRRYGTLSPRGIWKKLRSMPQQKETPKHSAHSFP